MIRNNDSVRQGIDSIAGLIHSMAERNALKPAAICTCTPFSATRDDRHLPRQRHASIGQSVDCPSGQLTVTATCLVFSGLSDRQSRVRAQVVLGAISPVPADGDQAATA